MFVNLYFVCIFFLDTSVAKIAHEMQVVVERMVNECSDDVHYSKLNVPIANDNYMIPTKENDYSNLKFEYNPQENVRPYL